MIESLGLDDRVYKIRITLHKDSSLKGARLYIIADKLKKLGQIYKTGWEGIEDRVRAGKDPRGTIKLSAGQEQGHIYIKIEDDGTINDNTRNLEDIRYYQKNNWSIEVSKI